MKKLIPFSLLASSLLFAAPVAHADLLVDPAGGTSLTSFNDDDPLSSDPDDGQQQIALGGAFNFYGTTLNSIYVDVNGFLTPSNNGYGYSADRSVGTLASVITASVISPFYDDLYLDDTLGDTITTKTTADFTAVTWSISGYDDASVGFESVFQAALITAPTTLMGNAFLPGDIVFSYAALNSTVSGDDFSVGVAASSTNATGAFGVGTGQFTTQAGFLGNFDSSTQALLFRADPTGAGYTQSLITYQAVPEPGTFAALGLAGLALLRRRRR